MKFSKKSTESLIFTSTVVKRSERNNAVLMHGQVINKNRIEMQIGSFVDLLHISTLYDYP